MLKKELDKKCVEMGKVYKKGRQSIGYSQEKVAEDFNVSYQYISELERGKAKGSVNLLIDSCNKYNITPNDILAPFIDFHIPTTDSRLFGYNSLTDEHKDIIECMIKALNEKQKK